MRNAGNGIAVLHGWYPHVDWSTGAQDHEPPERFRRLTRDLYIPAGDLGFWQGAVRDLDDPLREPLLDAVARHERMTIDILYGDHDGGQRTIARFGLRPVDDGGYLFSSSRYWNIDQPDPR